MIYGAQFGGVRQQGQPPLLAQLGKAGQVDHAALGGSHVNFKVAGVMMVPAGL